MKGKYILGCLVTLYVYVFVADGLQSASLAELLNREVGQSDPDSIEEYERLSGEVPPSVDDIETLKSDLTALAKLNNVENNDVYNPRVDSDEEEDPADLSYQPEARRFFTVKSVTPREFSPKFEAFSALLRNALKDAKDQQPTEEYLSHLETDERNADRRGLRTKFISVPKGRMLRSKKFLCDRNGNCGKRANWKQKLRAPFKTYLEISDNSKEKSVTPNANYKRNRNTNAGQNYNREKELNGFYFSNADFPEINKLLGKKKISKKQFYSSVRRIKRSLNAVKKVSSETTTKDQDITNSKDSHLFKEQQIKQYCLTHKCGIKADEKRTNVHDRQTTDQEMNVSKQNDRAVFLKLLKQIRGSGKRGLTAVNLNSEQNIARHAQIKRANPFCPPWGCRRRRNEILTEKPSLKDITKGKIIKSILSVANWKKGVNVGDKVSEPVRHRNYSFDRSLRLSPFCPHRGCRG